MDKILTNKGILEKSPSVENVIYSIQAVYEVIRVVDGVPLFLNEHFDRLIHSIQFQNWKLPMNSAEFKNRIYHLIALNQRESGNVKFEFYMSGNETNWVFRFIPHSYPTPEDYENGVPTDLLLVERENPNAKVIQNEIREKSNQLIAGQNLFEVLLVDRNRMITEGSRSNVFFVKDQIFYTAPSSMILVGITRQKVMECLKSLNYGIVEEAISVNQLSQFDSAFLTGTSPKVLPISTIGKLSYSTKNPSVNELIVCYNQLIFNYVRTEKE